VTRTVRTPEALIVILVRTKNNVSIIKPLLAVYSLVPLLWLRYRLQPFFCPGGLSQKVQAGFDARVMSKTASFRFSFARPGQSHFPSPTGRGPGPLSASGLAGMAATALCGDYLPGVVFDKEEEFLMNRHRTLQVVDKSLRIGFAVTAHRHPS